MIKHMLSSLMQETSNDLDWKHLPMSPNARTPCDRAGAKIGAIPDTLEKTIFVTFDKTICLSPASRRRHKTRLPAGGGGMPRR